MLTTLSKKEYSGIYWSIISLPKSYFFASSRLNFYKYTGFFYLKSPKESRKFLKSVLIYSQTQSILMRDKDKMDDWNSQIIQTLPMYFNFLQQNFP